MAPLSRLLVLVLLAASSGLRAQSIQLQRAKTFRVENYGGRSVTKLRGDVTLRGNDGLFVCDSADWFRNENRFFAYGNVRFTARDGSVIRANRLEYLNGESYFSGGVRVTNGEQTLSTAQLRYNAPARRGTFNSPAQIRTQDGSLSCRRGSFEGSNYVFVGNVVWNGSNERLRSEHMEYNAQSRKASLPLGGSGSVEGDSVVFGRGSFTLASPRSFELMDGVEGWGEMRRFTSGSLLRHPDSERSEWRGAVWFFDWESDSTELWGDLLRTTSDSVRAQGNARVRMPSWSGAAEVWRGHRKDSLYLLEGTPAVWSGTYQILADYVYLDRCGPGDSLWATNGVHLSETSDSTGKSNQLAADILHAQIRNQKMKRMDLLQNAQALFYPENGPASSMKSARIEMYFNSDGSVDELRFLPSPNGSAVQDPAPRFLPGYANRWGERPAKTDAISGLK